MCIKKHALLQRVVCATTRQEQAELVQISSSYHLSATLLPIRSVGVQGDARSYSYVVGLSSDQPPNWNYLLYLAKLIPRVCHNVNR